MLLCLDVGNTHILAGVFKNNNLLARFRHATAFNWYSRSVWYIFN